MDERKSVGSYSKRNLKMMHESFSTDVSSPKERTFNTSYRQSKVSEYTTTYRNIYEDPTNMSQLNSFKAVDPNKFYSTL